MPVYVRDAGAWKEAVPRARTGGAWTDETDQLFARDAGSWDLIYPDPASVSSLLPVEGLAVTAGPDHNSVTIGWTNPTQPDTTPTNVQVRIAELGSVWAEFTYPITSYAWAALSPSTEYVAQVRLIERVDGVRTTTSATRSVAFTTTAAPVGEPAPDPGGSGGETTVPIDPGAGGFPGGGTPPSTSDGCWIEYKIEMLSQVAYTFESGALDILTSDDGVTAIAGETDGDADSIEFDMASLTQGRVHRLCWRSACDTDSDSTADDFGDWNCGAPFPVGDDWGTPCAGVPDTASVLSASAMTDVAFRYPQHCLDPEDGLGLVMIESESGVEVARGPGFFGFFTDGDGEQGATPLTTLTAAPFYPVMVAPLAALLTTLVQGGDWTIVSSFRALGSFSGSNGRVWTIGSYAGSAVNIKVTESATGWTPSATVLTDDGITTITGTEITFDSGATHRIVLRWDDDGNLALFQDGTSAATVDVTSIQLYEDAASEAGINSAPAGVALMQQLGWDRALSDVEIGELSTASFFGTISMLREFWAEDPDWTNPGNGNNLTTATPDARDNGSLAVDGIAVAGATYVDAGINGLPSFRFNGSSWIDMPTGGVSSTGGYSVFAVAQLERGDRIDTILDDSTGGNQCYVSKSAANRWRMYGNSGAIEAISSGTDWSDLHPHLIVAEYDASGGSRLLVDGVEVASDATGALAATVTGFTIGSNFAHSAGYVIGDVAYAGQYQGIISDDAGYAVWSAAIIEYYACGSPVIPDWFRDYTWLRAYLPYHPLNFNTSTELGQENDVLSFVDAEGTAGNNLGLGTVTYSIRQRDSGINGEICWDTNSASASTGGIASVGSATVTALPWTVVMVAQLQQIHADFGYMHDSRLAGSRMIFGYDNSGNWTMNNTATLEGSGGAADTDPHVFVLVCTSTTLDLYIDGVLEISDTGTGSNGGGVAVGWAGTTGGGQYHTDMHIGTLLHFSGDLTAQAGYAAWLTEIAAHFGITA